MEHLRGLPDDLPAELPSFGEQVLQLQKIQESHGAALQGNGLIDKARLELPELAEDNFGPFDTIRPMVYAKPVHPESSFKALGDIIGIQFEVIRMGYRSRRSIQRFTPIAWCLGDAVMPLPPFDEYYTDEDAIHVADLAAGLRLERDTGLLPDLRSDLTRITRKIHHATNAHEFLD